MSKVIKYSDVQRTLLSLGFTVDAVKQSHRVYTHTARRSVVVLPFRNLSSPVDQTRLAAIRRVLIETNVVKPDAVTELFFHGTRHARNGAATAPQ